MFAGAREGETPLSTACQITSAVNDARQVQLAVKDQALRQERSRRTLGTVSTRSAGAHAEDAVTLGCGATGRCPPAGIGSVSRDFERIEASGLPRYTAGVVDISVYRVVPTNR